MTRMNRYTVGRLMRMSGVDIGAVRRSVRGASTYRRNRQEFLAQAAGSQGEFDIADDFPCLTDRFESSGEASGHYFHTDLHVAQLIHERRPDRHVDVGSRVDGFVAHVAVSTPVEVMDIRPLTTSAKNIAFRQWDVMQPQAELEQYCDSLSSLHALEHFGLGRYGDPVAYDGYRCAWENLSRMVRPGGSFYFAVPISQQQRVEFDAHRVFSVPFILDELVQDAFEVASFAYVDDAGELHTGVDHLSAPARSSFGLTYGCGIFDLTASPLKRSTRP